MMSMMSMTMLDVLWLRNMSLYPSLGDRVTSSFGLVLTIGGVLATISAVVGALGVGRNVERLVDLGGEVAASGGSPTQEQQSRLDQLSSSLDATGRPSSSCCCWPSSRWRPRAIGSRLSALR